MTELEYCFANPNELRDLTIEHEWLLSSRIRPMCLPDVRCLMRKSTIISFAKKKKKTDSEKIFSNRYM